MALSLAIILALLSAMPALAGNVGSDRSGASPDQGSPDVVIGNDQVNFVAVEYDTPSVGKSTWYYTVISGSGPAISHVTFQLGDCFVILDAGTWNGVSTNSRVSGGGSPIPGGFPASPQTDPTTGIKGLKFDQGFAGGETRHYYFTVNANVDSGNITVATKGGSGYDSGLVTGPNLSCDPAPPLAVVLSDFSAACVGATPVISWETVSELTNQGFNLYRGPNSSTPDTQLNATLIASQGPGSAQGFIYSWTDTTAAANTDHFYWLEDVNFAGATTIHGPIAVTCSVPTAVTLSGLTADNSAAAAFSGWMFALALGAMLASFVAVRRMRTN